MGGGGEGMDCVEAQESSFWAFIHLLFWWEVKRVVCVCVHIKYIDLGVKTPQMNATVRPHKCM